MPSRRKVSKSDGEPAREAVPKSETAGPGGGGKSRTQVGAGDSGDGGGGAWQGMSKSDRDPERKVLYSHLKDMAIDALELSRVKDQASIAQSISMVLGTYDMQVETADVLASMVVAAYSCARELHDEKAVFLAYSCFTDAQLERILKLARST
jgi:hypothetical protein